MNSRPTTPPASDLVSKVGELATGFSVLMTFLFPFAVPGLVLALLLVLPLLPLALAAALFWLLARAVRLPVRLLRRRSPGFEQDRPQDLALHTRSA
jgi:hypothetical protein